MTRGKSIHKRLPHILARNHTLFLIGEMLMARRKEVEHFFDLGFLVAGDVVFLGEFGLSRFRGFLGCCRGGGGCPSALLGGLWRAYLVRLRFSADSIRGL